MKPRIEVVAALLLRDGRFLLARRIKDDSIGRVWEFPGGRVEPGETLEVALARELREELGVVARIEARRFVSEHEYADLALRLHFFDCAILDGEPCGREGQELRWASAAELQLLELPEADREMVKALVADG